MKKKLSNKEQVERIKMIMKNDNMINCDNCKHTYLPLSSIAELVCPICGIELHDTDDYYEDDYETFSLNKVY